MGERLAKLLLLTIPLGGCSKLYDPERLPNAADAPRPPPDVFPCEMEVTELATLELVEGTGTGGSLPALLVVMGKNLVNQNTSVTIAPVAGTPKAPMLEIDSAKLEVGEYGGQLAVPITLPVDPMFLAGPPVALDVTVAQDCIEGQKTVTIPGKLAYRPLDELRDEMMTTTLFIDGGVHEYSQIEVVTRTIAPGPNNKRRPIVLRSTSSVKISKAISVDATNTTDGGNGAGNGGLGGTGLSGVGTPGTGPKAGITSGSPGGFNTSDPGLTTLEEPNRGSGGAGGDAGLLAARGGNGGGGGGSIEISAGGNLEVAAITARGAAGQAGQNGGADGGGGSGGVIFLRAGGTLTATGDIDVRSLGTGARGLARYDARGMAMVRPGETGASHYRGPLVSQYPPIVRSPTPTFTVAGKPLESFQYFAIKQGGAVSAVSTALFGADGTARVVFTDKLAPGANQVCVIPTPGTPTAETRNCVSIAYLE